MTARSARGYGWALGAVIAAARLIAGRPSRPWGPAPSVGVVVGAHVLVATAWLGPLAPLIGVLAAASSMMLTVLAARRGRRHRLLTDAEQAFVTSEFVDAEWVDRVVITGFVGRGGRAFAFPGIDGFTYLNLGAVAAAPTRGTSSAYPVPGQLFVHELAHAEQIAHAESIAVFLAEAVEVQARHSMGEPVYEPDVDPAVVIASREPNIEQRATAIDRRFAARVSTDDR